MTFAIDRIPSLADRMPYASYVVLYGDESDGVPVYVGDGGDSAYQMPAPPKKSIPLDDTIPMRRPL